MGIGQGGGEQMVSWRWGLLVVADFNIERLEMKAGYR
jgi:hypothetical protein